MNQKSDRTVKCSLQRHIEAIFNNFYNYDKKMVDYSTYISRVAVLSPPKRQFTIHFQTKHNQKLKFVSIFFIVTQKNQTSSIFC